MDSNISSYPTYKDFPASGPLTARVEALLLCNDPPSATERHDLSTIVQTAPDILADLDQQIAYLSNQRNQIASYFRNARTILHPIRLVPDDVLYHVFQHMYDGDSSSDTLDSTQGLWPASQTCRQWRSIIINTPRLWSRIHIHFRPLSNFQLSRTMFRLGVCLNRVRGQELDIALFSPQLLQGTPQEAIMYMIIPTASSWRSLNVSFILADLVCLDNAQGLLTTVTTIAVEVLGGGFSIPSEIFCMTPRLVRFTAHWAGHYRPDVFTVPWEQIIDLSLPSGVDEGGLIFIGRHFTNLTHLHLCCDTTNLLPLVDMPNMIHLTLVEHHNVVGALRTWFECLDVPELSSLKLVYETKPAKAPILLPGIDNKHPRLSHIEMVCCIKKLEVLPELAFRTFLESVSSTLRSLKLRVNGLPPALIGNVLMERTLVPTLESLDLRGTMTRDPMNSVLGICEARTRALKTLWLNQKLSFPPGSEGEQRWEILVQNGLVAQYGPRLEPFAGRIRRSLHEDDKGEDI
ncbi:hypothetical protein BDZ89DRAFT_1072688 [Hymenopellis radicata]|nr:hypothetical protein BDZ89DRAFT_1072688 [Hymenopellis radicata]